MEKNLKECSNCKTVYPKKLNQCPNCNYKEPMKLDEVLWIFILLLLIVMFFQKISALGSDNTMQRSQNAKEEIFLPREISIRPLSNFSGLSRDEIFAKRKKYVQESVIFNKIKNYSPNKNVYKIEDNLGWISAYEISKNGVKNNPDITKGASRHSISINNPELLISFIIPTLKRDEKTPFSELDYFLPYRIVWDKQKNTIRAHFKITDFFKSKQHKWTHITVYPDETNARDLGYDWVYAYNKKGVFFENKTNNMSIKPYKMKGYYHKGFACGLKEGCNNYSPFQSNMIFNIKKEGGYINFKLYKKQPNIHFSKPDIYYEMYFD